VQQAAPMRESTLSSKGSPFKVNPQVPPIVRATGCFELRPDALRIYGHLPRLRRSACSESLPGRSKAQRSGDAFIRDEERGPTFSALGQGSTRKQGERGKESRRVQAALPSVTHRSRTRRRTDQRRRKKGKERFLYLYGRSVSPTNDARS